MLATTSSQFLRGDEANLAPCVDTSATVYVFGSYELHRRERLVARVTNLFNARYETFGLLGEAAEVPGDEFDDPRFLSQALPARHGLESSSRCDNGA